MLDFLTKMLVNTDFPIFFKLLKKCSSKIYLFYLNWHEIKAGDWRFSVFQKGILLQ